MKFKKPAFSIKTTWTDGTVVDDIYMTKKAVI